MSAHLDLAETPLDRATRLAMGAAYLLRPKRIGHLPALGLAVAADMLRGGTDLPDPACVRDHPPGFGGVLLSPDPDKVAEAARRGFYPSAHLGPMKWWSPPQRAVMPLANVHLAKRFRRTLKTTDQTVSFDRDFAGVVRACAEPRPGHPRLTWITPPAMELYGELHARGLAHSVEVWNADGALVGGLFGVVAGPVFSALSMFHTEDNASKTGIANLYHHLDVWGFAAVDHQMMSPWVQALGAIELPRASYLKLLAGPAPAHALPGGWSAEKTPRETAEWRPSGAAEPAAG